MHNEVENNAIASSTHQQVVADLQAQLHQQYEAVKWLQQQRESWEQAARAHEKTIEELRAHAQQQHESLLWLEEQRARWQQEASANEQTIAELRARVRRLEEFAERTTLSGPLSG